MIEKNIFQSWYTKTLPPYVDDFLKMNTEYKYYLYDDDDMDKFVKEHYPGEIYECYNRLNIIVAKVDLWRYLILYKYGGIYLDMDSSINKPLTQLIKEDDHAIITAEGNPFFFVQWALIFESGHPILRRTIEYCIENIKTNAFPNDIHKVTGPTVYTRAIQDIHRELYGNVITSRTSCTDITYAKGNVQYRLFGVDYNSFFSFKHPLSRI